MSKVYVVVESDTMNHYELERLVKSNITELTIVLESIEPTDSNRIYVTPVFDRESNG